VVFPRETTMTDRRDDAPASTAKHGRAADAITATLIEPADR
jgi:hypothetical protein